MSDNNSEYDVEDILSMAMDVGEYMLKCGAEVWRVEDTIGRICTAYGCSQTDVFSITSMIISSTRHSGRICTQSRRIRSYSYNLKQLEELNALSRRICSENLPPQDVTRMMNAIITNNMLGIKKKAGAYILAVFAFTIFFGGTIPDAIAATVISMIIFFADSFFNKGHINMLAYTVLMSCIAGFAAIGLTKTGLLLHLDKIIIGNVMLLIPGVGLTNAIRDLLCGDIVSGLLRLCEAILLAISVAVGFAIPLLVTGGGF